jgi:cell division protein FtsQ
MRRLLPSARSLLVGWAIVAAAVGGYLVARETSLFAIDRIVVEGAPPAVAVQVRRSAAGTLGQSLVALDGAALLGRVQALPWVRSARYDRAFPHTLRLLVRPEQPVAVLRAGARSWLVAGDARVLQPVRRRAEPGLPRIWVQSSTSVAVGQRLDRESGGAAARTLAPLARGSFPRRIVSVSLAGDELVFALVGGLQLRLGRPEDLRLKLAVARGILPHLPGGTGYLDVSVPERPVSGPAQPPTATATATATAAPASENLQVSG